jgi:hypothetical protein
MDRTLSILLCILIASIAAVAGMFSLDAYTGYAYQNSFSGNYSFLCTIATDAPLTNVTLFIPVPVDSSGNSPTAASFSSGTVAGLPAGWEATLFDTGKSTLVKITAPAIVPPEGTGPASPYAITLTSESSSPEPIDTMDPLNRSALFRPVQDLKEVPCPAGKDGNEKCFTYTTAAYATYDTDAGTTVTIACAITGRNSWNIFGPSSNEYHAGSGLRMQGGQHGWQEMNGELTSGSGNYDYLGAK